jgi:hypothetical protein
MLSVIFRDWLCSFGLKAKADHGGFVSAFSFLTFPAFSRKRGRAARRLRAWAQAT